MNLREQHSPTRGAVPALTLTLLITLTVSALVQLASPEPSAASTARRPKPTATATATPTPAPSPTPSPTPTPAPTATPSPSPTATPSPSTHTSPSSTPPPADPCAANAPVLFGGASYCPAYLSYVLATAYGVGQRVVLQGLVTAVGGTTVTIEAGSPCYPADAYCGQTLIAAPAAFPAGAPLPGPGEYVNVYGVTVTGGLAADGYEFLFSCPDWAC